MEIYAVEHDIGNLLLVDGRDVINGSYKLIFHKDGSAGNNVNNIKAHHVMTVPQYWLRGKWNDNDVLDKAEKALRKRKVVV